MQDDIYVGPPTFSLAPQWPPHTFLIVESPLSVDIKQTEHRRVYDIKTKKTCS